ncbi:MAG: hypothetical protein A2Y21_09805 [Clostridiales bacterium GWC2_40_7]|nr:MAG: hypothetical protein A2Y21_09805 [Clostridiales bacterium GWC2_40_7]
MDELVFETILKVVDYRNKLAVQALELLKPECDKIIWSNCSDKLEIERVLDRLLDFCFDEKILKVYRKLCRHYYNIDTVATTQYVNTYREMWDEG